jgi:Tfp pilus assembly protein PilW
MKKHKGMTLIEIMIGLVISMIIILAMFSLYKYAVSNIFGSTDNRGFIANAKQDARLSTSLITLQNIIQGAGFGFTSRITTNFILGNNVSLENNNTLSASSASISINNTEQTGNALFWETNNNIDAATTSYQCHGIISDSSTKAVYLLNKESSCNPINTNWKTTTWNKSVIVESGVLTQALQFKAIKSTACSPFGVNQMAASSETSPTPTPVPNAGLRVTIVYSNSTTVSANSSYSVCLSNYAE